VEKSKAVRRIDNAILELSARGANKASDIIGKSTHIETLSELLARLQNGNETLLDTTLTVIAYDDNGKTAVKRSVKRRLRELGFTFTENAGRQADAYLSVGFHDKLNVSRGIQSSSVAACFPFVSNALVEDGGLLIGGNDLPVFVDFWKRDGERVNSNMVIVGKPGSGKSYAAKTLLCDLASCGAKIFVLDPENEYGKIAESLGGRVLDAASAKHGVINPFHVIGSLKDETDTDAGDGSDGAFYAHLRFLEQFFKSVFIGLNNDCMELLNKATLDTYRVKGVTGDTRLESLGNGDYPTFDDLAATVDKETETETDPYTLSQLKNVRNYLSKFKSGGRNSALWNGASSFGLTENFVCFNFQRLLADKNETVANAQMLLILKWLENEVIKNRDYNIRNGTHRKIAVVVDEAHLFVNEQYPVALDFMFQIAKRIRKYDGMQIVITQNIKDFAGTPEIARKSTAIINVSQYSLIFSLSPNDMNDLCKLYEKAGEINESEQTSIVYNPRGRAFFIYGPASRTNISVTATPYVKSLFM
jgi:type IV secretory pathway VirB4 component